MNLYSFHDKPDTLHKHKEADTEVVDHFWKKYDVDSPVKAREHMKSREAAIAKSADFSYRYAKDILCGPFPAGEEAISTHTYCSFGYAKFVLKGPFKKGEDVIADDGHYSFRYADEVLHAPFPKGENEIASLSAKQTFYYATCLLKKEWPKGEDSISKDGFLSASYASDTTKKPFPKGEPAMVKNCAPRVIDAYLKCFPEREEAIEDLR